MQYITVLQHINTLKQNKSISHTFQSYERIKFKIYIETFMKMLY